MCVYVWCTRCFRHQDLAMVPKRHAQQVFDRIEAGEFYMICDNIRPYVDHDYPLDGAALVKQRASWLTVRHPYPPRACALSYACVHAYQDRASKRLAYRVFSMQWTLLKCYALFFLGGLVMKFARILVWPTPFVSNVGPRLQAFD